ncbi:MAG TPA: hypothetical protein PLS95_01150 [Thermoanaerobaculales bacterium]|nr:hypothetical protein [Thermoanaerobaculales bacterium]
MTRAQAYARASLEVAMERGEWGAYRVSFPHHPLRPHALALLGVPYDTAERATLAAMDPKANGWNSRTLFTKALAWLRAEDRRRMAK